MRLHVCLAVLALGVWGTPILAETAAPTPSGTKQAYAAIVKREAEGAGLPADIADAVMAIESGYDPSRIGSAGEIGLMQVMPETAALLGFIGSTAELAKPPVNIHYGVAYLAEAWRRANGDLCRALMKYRAGHGEEIMSPLSVTYCSRARDHLAAAGSVFAGARLALASPATDAKPSSAAGIPRLNKHLRGAAFWAVQEARVKAIDARVHRRWRMMAAR